MSIMGTIFSKVFDEGRITASTVSRDRGMVHSAALGLLCYPQPVDIENILGRFAARRETLQWRTSIVDFLKLLNVDCGLAARRQLAYELGYGGSVEDSGTMNMWLQREVMRKLANCDHRVLDAAID